jgi:exonuclease SbcD
VFLKPEDLDGLPLQVLALPWISRSGLIAHLGPTAMDLGDVYEELEKRLTELVQGWLEEIDPGIPTILTAHCSIQGAVYGGERTVMLGNDLVLPGSLVRDPRLDYVALGHIHKPQDLNEGAHPPVIYPGSIERVDFGEAGDDKFYIIARVERGKTQVEWRKLTGIRPFIDRQLRLSTPERVTDQIMEIMPMPEAIRGAIFRLILEYPRDWETLIDEAALREYAGEAFEFHLVKRPQVETRIRLPEDQAISDLSPIELLNLYWNAAHLDPGEIDDLSKLATSIILDQLDDTTT